MIETNGFGFGFQQMGIIGPMGLIQEKIKILIGGYLNIYDGSTLSAKLIFEFGIFSIFFVIIYLIYFLKFINKLLNKNYKSNHEAFYYLSFISLFILLFVRSASYFTPSFFFFFVGLIGIYNVKNKLEIKARN